MQFVTAREDLRERLIEARHVVNMMEVEEKQMSVSPATVVCVYVYMYVYMYVCMYVCMYVRHVSLI